MAEYRRKILSYEGALEKTLDKLNEATQKKILKKLEYVTLIKIPAKTILKKLQNSDNIFEIKIKQGSKEYRILGFFDDEDYGTPFVITNFFLKKGTKDYNRHIAIANKQKIKFYEENN